MKLFLIKINKDKHKVAQRILSFRKKARLTVMQYSDKNKSKYSNLNI